METKHVMPTKAKKFILERLIPFILRERGNGFIMEDWLREYTKDDTAGEEGLFYFDGVEHRVPSCGHVGCIGGSVDFLQKVSLGKRQNDARVAKVLGLTLEQGKGLFYNFGTDRGTSEYGWPEDFAARFVAATTPYKKARVVVALLKQVVKTNGECLNPVW
jgi:hypothetical protein